MNIIKKSILLCSAVTGLFITGCDKTQNKSLNMENHENVKGEGAYACPMHPEITGDKGGKCSKCGMDLELIAKNKPNDVEVKITSIPKKADAGKLTQLVFSITGNGKNADLDVVHEKKIHLLIVDEELTWFDHIHTEKLPNGTYTATETFPHSGNYILYTDFKVSGSPGNVDKQMLEVGGTIRPKTDTAAGKWISKVDGYTVTLANGNDFKTQRTEDIGITIQKNGNFISGKDIEPYLGAVAHIIVISKEDKDFLHVHPTSNERFPIQGETRFEKSGLYRMWVQFKIDGKIHTADFTINVTKGDKVTKSGHTHSEHSH